MLTGYQSEWIRSRASHKAALCGRRLGKSHQQAVGGALRMLGVTPTLDGQGFEPDVDGPTSQIITSASELQSQQLLRSLYEQVERLAQTGIVGPELYPNEPSANTFSLRCGVTARAFADNPRVIRGGSADWLADEFEFSRDAESLFAAASLVAAPTLARPRKGGFRISVTSSAFVGGTFAAALMDGDGTEVNDRWRHFVRWKISAVDAVKIFGFPQPGLTLEEQDEYLERMRRELGDVIWQSEMLCQHVSGSDLWLAPEIMNRARYEPHEHPPAAHVVSTYGGADIARSPTGDLSCRIRVVVDSRGIMWAHSAEVGRGVDFEAQQNAIGAMLTGGVRRVAVDASGMGAPVAEALVKKFGSAKIEPITWTASTKTALFEGLHHALDTGRLRIPNDIDLLRDLTSYRRIPRANGTAGFEARGSDGHGDRTAALAMAVSLAGVSHQATRVDVVRVVDKYRGVCDAVGGNRELFHEGGAGRQRF